MSDFLSNLVARHLNMVEVVRPRLAALFEPPQGAGTSAAAAPTEIANLDLTSPVDREHPAMVSEERSQSSQRAASAFLSVSSEALPPVPNPTMIEPVRAARYAQAQGPGQPAEALGESFTPSEIEARTRSTSASQDGGSSREIASDVGPGGSSSEGSPPGPRSVVTSRVVRKTGERPVPGDTEAPLATLEPTTKSNGAESAPSPNEPPREAVADPGAIRPRHAPEGLSSRLVERHSGTEASAASEEIEARPIASRPLTPVQKGGIAATSPVVVQPRMVPIAKAGEIEPAQPLEATQPAPAVQVTIGRIEIRAAPPVVPAGKQRPASRVMSLDDYLNKRDRGGHGR